MNEPVRIGVVGLGNFGRLHAQTLHGLAEADLVGLVDSNPTALDAARAGSSAFLLGRHLRRHSRKVMPRRGLWPVPPHLMSQ